MKIRHEPMNEEEIKALYARLGEGLESGWILCTGVIPKAPKASSKDSPKDSPKEPPQNTPNFSRESLREMLMETARRVRLEPRSEEEYQQAKLREFQMFERSYREAVDRLMSKKQEETPAKQSTPDTSESLHEILIEVTRRVRLEPTLEREYQQAKHKENRMFEKALREVWENNDQTKAAGKQSTADTNETPEQKA